MNRRIKFVESSGGVPSYLGATYFDSIEDAMRHIGSHGMFLGGWEHDNIDASRYARVYRQDEYQRQCGVLTVPMEPMDGEYDDAQDSIAQSLV